MANHFKNFSDTEIKCKKCFAKLAEERLDRQVLIVGGVAFFNFASFACIACSSVHTWQSPNLLRGENESFETLYPDRLDDTPRPSKALLGRLGVRGVTKTKSGKYKARIVINGKTKYLGSFDSIGAASRAYERAQQTTGQNAQTPESNSTESSQPQKQSNIVI